MRETFLNLKQQALKQRISSANDRIELLNRLDAVIMNNLDQITGALFLDLHKSKSESLLTEIYPLRQEIKYVIKNLKNWMQTQPVSAPLSLKFSKAFIHHQAKGVCLIISPWNYPFQLAVAPVIAALAAGNTCLIKPSEIAPETSKVIKLIVELSFQNNICAVIEGNQEVTTHILKYPFNHIFFTGSTAVGKIIMQAASQHLTSVTLELGGKSPAIVTTQSNIKKAAEKIIWGKIVNRGQTCVAPDFVIVHESLKDQFINELIHNIKQLDQNDTTTRIINHHHFLRLNNLISTANNQFKKIYGSIIDESKLMLDLHLYDCGQLRIFNESLMNEEIFGPILPIISYSNEIEILNYLNSHPQPLALYLFSESSTEHNLFIQNISCGGMCINDCLIHVAHHSLPFGGIGESGMGNYHGHAGFLTFTHQKSILKQGLSGRLLKLFYPPYTAKVEKIIEKMTKWNV